MCKRCWKCINLRKILILMHTVSTKSVSYCLHCAIIFSSSRDSIIVHILADFARFFNPTGSTPLFPLMQHNMFCVFFLRKIIFIVNWLYIKHIEHVYIMYVMLNIGLWRMAIMTCQMISSVAVSFWLQICSSFRMLGRCISMSVIL